MGWLFIGSLEFCAWNWAHFPHERQAFRMSVCMPGQKMTSLHNRMLDSGQGNEYLFPLVDDPIMGGELVSIGPELV